MTAELPGPSAGEQIVQEELGRPPFHEHEKGFARRIDAALAEVARDRDTVVEMAAARVTEIAAERDELRRELTECRHEANAVLEAENALLRRAVEAKEPRVEVLWPQLRVWGEECQTRKMKVRDAEAALAEADARIALLESYYCPEHIPSAPPPPMYLCEVCERVKAETALAEREAQIAALREALLAVGDTRQFGNCWCSTIDRTYCVGQPACKKAKEAVTFTADAAARCLARARQEGAEEMRERCVQRVEAEPELEGEPPSRVKAAMQTASPTDNARAAVRATKASIVAAIRALDAGAPARRG